MAVIMKRSTNSAPESLSTSYLMGSAFMGISMMTLNSFGTSSPAVTLLMLISTKSSCRGRPCSLSVDGNRTRSAARGEWRPCDGRKRTGARIDCENRDVAGTIVCGIHELTHRIDHDRQRENSGADRRHQGESTVARCDGVAGDLVPARDVCRIGEHPGGIHSNRLWSGSRRQRRAGNGGERTGGRVDGVGGNRGGGFIRYQGEGARRVDGNRNRTGARAERRPGNAAQRTGGRIDGE